MRSTGTKLAELKTQTTHATRCCSCGAELPAGGAAFLIRHDGGLHAFCFDPAKCVSRTRRTEETTAVGKRRALPVAA